MTTKFLPVGGLNGRHDNTDWQCRGRCSDCSAKVVGPRRVRSCLCGGKVRY